LASTPAIGLLGDVMLGRSVADRLRQEPPEEVWSPEVRELCSSLDAVVANLECCISERGERTNLIPGKPFFFRGPPAAVESLHAIGATAVSIANNHALDYGPEAFEDTLALLEGGEIAVTGTGSGVVVEAGERSLGVLGITDHPREYAPAVAYADLRAGLPDWAAAELERLGNQADLVLAFPHWGPNMTEHPARWQRQRAREMLEAGADAVAGHSAHVFHGIGSERGIPLLFDLGDALDDYAVDSRLRNDLGVLALWRPGSPDSPLDLVGLRLDYCRTGLAYDEDAEWIARRLAGACEQLNTRIERIDEHTFRVNRH
jgi:poly-gamma-glutamate capsule biosynthesis protein CapA/YwtB (metallophosphatase superfamily)